jgi:quinol monooxygenase YgiN
MGRHAVVVSFEVEDASRTEFLQLLQANAAASVEQEPGCRRFDIVAAPDGVFHLYEIYDDATAFADHLETPHFRTFDDATRAMIRAKRIVRGEVFETVKR